MNRFAQTINRILILTTALIAVSHSATVTLDFTAQYQTIEGFGAHGAMDVWWSSGPFYTPQFLDRVVDDLGKGFSPRSGRA